MTIRIRQILELKFGSTLLSVETDLVGLTMTVDGEDGYTLSFDEGQQRALAEFIMPEGEG